MNSFENDILEDLYNYALDHNIGILSSHEFSSSMTALADTKKRLIIINSGQSNKQQLPFQVAHEISHVMNGDKSTHLLAFNSIHSDPQIETQANRSAIQMLLPYYANERQIGLMNYTDFMSCFAIPSHLEAIVVKEFQKYNDKSI
mgnify:CR=1 FL=1